MYKFIFTEKSIIKFFLKLKNLSLKMIEHSNEIFPMIFDVLSCLLRQVNFFNLTIEKHGQSQGQNDQQH